LPGAQDGIERRFDHGGRYSDEFVVIGRKATLVNDEILAFDKSVPPQLIQECQMLRCFTRIGAQECKPIGPPQLLGRCCKRRK
jgi:hypothetical protein